MLKLITEIKVTLTHQKIKDNVVHVGHSQPSVLLKVYQPNKEKSKISLNNNSLIVQPHMVTTDVTEVLWIMLSLSLEITVSFTKMNTDMLEEIKNVLKPVVPIKSKDSLTLKLEIVMLLKTPSKATLSQSLSMPQTGNSTVPVSSTTAKPD